MSSSKSEGSSKKSNDEIRPDACVVCFKNFDIFSIGSCDHPVCYECSTRMRVLCKQMECPICRQELVKVAFVECVKPFQQLSFNNYLMDKSTKIYFENQSIQEAFTKLLVHPCQVCSTNPIFPNLQTLKDHLRKEHEHFFCELCVEHLKIFTSERRAYSRSELALHRRKGDADNTSHRGHPLCNFCDKRYVDGDELFRHLRRDHYFCHFCDADGLNQFYCAYEDLREHFRDAHFLCEEGECKDEKFTRVFRTDIDFRAHRAQVHSQSMGKAAARQARTLELEFTLAPRPTSDNKGRTQRRVGSRIQTREEPSTSTAADLDTQRTVSSASVATTADLRNPDNFPRLGQVQQTHDQGTVATQTRSSTSDSLAQKIAKGSRFTVRNSNGSQSDEFPSLTSMETSSAAQPSIEISKTEEKPNSKGDGAKRSVNLRASNKEEKKHNGNARVDNNQNVSIQLMQTYPPIVAQGVGPPPSQPVARVTRVSTSQNIHVQPSRGLRLDSDFPSLVPAAPTLQEPSSSKASWVKKDPPKPIKITASKGNLQTKEKPSRPSALEDYPALSHTTSKPQAETPRLNSVKVKAAVVNGNKNTLPVKPTAASVPVVESWSESSKSRGKKKKSNQVKSNNSSDPEETITFTSTAERKVSEMQLGELKSLSTLMGGTRLDLSAVANATESKSFGSKVGLIKQPLENKSNENGGAKPKTKAKPIPLNQSDFPALGQFSSSTPTPIFFEKKKPAVSRPPEQVAPTKVTFTSSSGQNFPLSVDDDSLTRKFLQPTNFSLRNQQLISTVMDLLCHQKSKIDKFRTVSTEFRSDQLKAEGYYLNCLEIMGEDCFLALFPELVCLLPDIDKQQQLLKVHRSQMRTKGPLGAEPYVVCATCNQILAPSDLKHHIASHSLETNFPCLGASDGSSAWSKR